MTFNRKVQRDETLTLPGRHSTAYGLYNPSIQQMSEEFLDGLICWNEFDTRRI